MNAENKVDPVFDDLTQQLIASEVVGSDTWKDMGSRVELFFNAKYVQMSQKQKEAKALRIKLGKEMEEMRRKLLKYVAEFDGVSLSHGKTNIILKTVVAPRLDEVATKTPRIAFRVIIANKDHPHVTWKHEGIFGVCVRNDQPLYGFRIGSSNTDHWRSLRSGDYEYLHENHYFVLNKGSEHIAELALVAGTGNGLSPTQKKKRTTAKMRPYIEDFAAEYAQPLIGDD